MLRRLPPLPPDFAITLRQLEVVLFVQSGRGYKQIAPALGIHQKTVQNHVERLARRLRRLYPEHDGDSRELVVLYADAIAAVGADLTAQVMRGFHHARPGGAHCPTISDDTIAGDTIAGDTVAEDTIA